MVSLHKAFMFYLAKTQAYASHQTYPEAFIKKTDVTEQETLFRSHLHFIRTLLPNNYSSDYEKHLRQ